VAERRQNRNTTLKAIAKGDGEITQWMLYAPRRNLSYAEEQWQGPGAVATVLAQLPGATVCAIRLHF
jgi:hypothetical protein